MRWITARPAAWLLVALAACTVRSPLPEEPETAGEEAPPGPAAPSPASAPAPKAEAVISEGVFVVVTPRQLIPKAGSEIGFKLGAAELLSGSLPALDEVAGVLRGAPCMRLRIEVHTDAAGVEAYNLKMSGERAAAVEAYLVAKGVAPTRLEAVGYGEDRPIADNATAAGRAKNRRVELWRAEADDPAPCGAEARPAAK
jgi:outer membrane protein OmpA-like peptidoglycan-associated protein